MDGGKHRQRVRGDYGISVGALRLICGLSPRVPEQNAGKHRPECTDDTIVFGLTWDDISPVTKPRQRNPRRFRLHPVKRLTRA